MIHLEWFEIIANISMESYWRQDDADPRERPIFLL